MSIKSEKFPDDFEEIFKRYDSPDRDKKDVAFLIWCENKALKEELNEVRGSGMELIYCLNSGRYRPARMNYWRLLNNLR